MDLLSPRLRSEAENKLAQKCKRNAAPHNTYCESAQPDCRLPERR